MTLRSIALVFVYSLLATLSHPADAQQRHAFVVGIDSYEEVASLQRARNDARAVEAALTEAGFRTELLLDPDEGTLLRALSSFSATLERGDEVAFFFAGHGVEIGGRNYLLPADIPNVSPGQELVILRQSLPLSDVIDQFAFRGVRLSVLFIDACRDNPFQTRGTRTLGRTRGLGDEAPPEGTFIVFSAGAGQAALDGLTDDDPHPNSVFTRTLVPRLTEPGLDLRRMVQQVRSEVRRLGQSVGFDQFPAVYDQLDGSFTFVPTGADAPDAARLGRLTTDPCEPALSVWETIVDGGSASVIEAFIATYDQSCPVLATLARQRLENLHEEGTSNAVPPSSPDERDPVVAEAESGTDSRPQIAEDAETLPADILSLTDRETTRAIQVELNRLGCFVGQADGIAGERTLNGIDDFLSSRGNNRRTLASSRVFLNELRQRSISNCPGRMLLGIADDLPTHVPLGSRTPSPMNCSVGPPFSTARHVNGTRGPITLMRGTFYIVCPTMIEIWNGQEVPINWFTLDGRGYTDCRETPETSYECWVALPNRR